MGGYWRIRLKNQEGDFTKDAWERSEIGIWYGAWGAEDFRNVNEQHRSNQQIADSLNELPAQQALVTSKAWDGPLSSGYVGTARRFFDKISEGDWAVVYLDTDQTLALAPMAGDVGSNSKHPLNTRAGETYKYRKIKNKKTFPLDRLPDAYRLVPTQGRGNVHGFSRMYEHVKLLAEHSTADEIVRVLDGMSFDQQLDLMGASGWESFCVTWLIMEQSFIPTDLSTGKTLKAVDIVGRNRVNGRRIIAQCKKDPYPVPIEKDFVSSLTANDEGYYFAYGGCSEQPSGPGIRVIDGAYARNWAETENGKVFQRLFLGNTKQTVHVSTPIALDHRACSPRLP
jgi:hypothetical protein